MTIRALFPTLVYSGTLRSGNWRQFNAQLVRECRQLRRDDAAGRRWSAQNYRGGYTSYSSASRMHQSSPTFARLERRLARHVQAFVHALELDVDARPLAMTDCWVNIMSRHGAHGLHLHPLSTISGTYYVQAPKGASGIKFEDPRLERMMAAPPRVRDARPDSRPWIVLPVEAGRLVLFESWLRHEVAPNVAGGERVSVSFNYSWF